MENREILVANTRTQKRSKITTDATTLGELKDALDAAGIDYSEMTFTEGISKTQLLDDNTQLPQNVMYKGQPTNSLVILLTNTKKNIASGISRKEVYQMVKDNNLQEAVKEEFGRNYTQVPTDDLFEFIDSPDNSLTEEDFEDAPKEEEDEDSTNNLLTSACIYNVERSLLAHITSLVAEKVLFIDDIRRLQQGLSNLVDNLNLPAKYFTPVSTSDGRITDSDIDDMLEDLNM